MARIHPVDHANSLVGNLRQFCCFWRDAHPWHQPHLIIFIL